MPDSPDTDPPAEDIAQSGLAEGTRVFTLRGEVPVEDLRPGDMLVTLSGKGPPLHRLAGLRRGHGKAVRLSPGALGPRIPARELVVGAGQALRVEGLLVPAGLLPEGPGIAAAPARPLLIPELAQPGLVMAEGTPVAALPAAPASPDPAALAALRARLAARAARPAPDGRDALLDLILDGEEALSAGDLLQAGAAPLTRPAGDG